MTPKQLVKHFGGVNNTARALEIQPPSVSEWLKNGRIPKLRLYQIRQIINGQSRKAARREK